MNIHSQAIPSPLSIHDGVARYDPNLMSPNLPNTISPSVRKPIFSLENAIAEKGIVEHPRQASKSKSKQRPSPYTIQQPSISVSTVSGSGSGSDGSLNTQLSSRSSLSRNPSSEAISAFSSTTSLAGLTDVSCNSNSHGVYPNLSIKADQPLMSNPAVDEKSFALHSGAYSRPDPLKWQRNLSEGNLHSPTSVTFSPISQHSQIIDLGSHGSQGSPEQSVALLPHLQPPPTTAGRAEENSAVPEVAFRQGAGRKSSAKLTQETRRQICEYARDHPKASQDVIGSVFGVERTTVSKTLKDATKWLSFARDDEQDVGTTCTARYPVIEAKVIDWISEQNTRGVSVSDAGIREVARKVAGDCDITPLQFKASDGWMLRFKQRAGLKKDGFLRRTLPKSPPKSLSLPLPQASAYLAGSAIDKALVQQSPMALNPVYLTPSSIGDVVMGENDKHSFHQVYSTGSSDQASIYGNREQSSANYGQHSYFPEVGGPPVIGMQSPLTTGPQMTFQRCQNREDALNANFMLWQYLHELNDSRFATETAWLTELYRKLSGI